MEHHLSNKELALYAEAINKPDFKEVTPHIIKHIQECNECAQEALFLSELIRSEEFQNIGFHSKKKPRVTSYIALAAAALIIIALAVWTLVTPNNEQIKNKLAVKESISQAQQKKQVKKPDYGTNGDTKKAEPRTSEDKSTNIGTFNEKEAKANEQEQEPDDTEMLYADNFVPNEDLESLVERFKGTLRSSEFTIYTNHEINLLENDSVLLQWSRTNDHLIVELFNNRGVRIAESSLKDSVYITSGHEPGLYYWKLMNEDFDLLFCGRIIINHQ